MNNTNTKQNQIQNQLKQMTKEALTTLCESLDQGKSDCMIEFLETMARFPKYSLRNLMLIKAQFPGASQVMGFHGWKQIGRGVKKGEQAIRVWAPMRFQRNAMSEGAGDSFDDSGAMLTFRPVCVFDIAQTEGEELPEPVRVSGDPGAHLERLKGLAAELSIKLNYDKALVADGLSKGGEIVLREGLTPADEFHVLAHEITHELLHGKETRKELSKRQAETEAEAVAFVVSRAVGLETSTAASDYIQLYKGCRETLEASLTQIQQTAARIIQAILH